MSLVAASFTKSAVVGLMPSVEFTPVFSLTDCASADVEISNAAAVIVSAVLFMSRVLMFLLGRANKSRNYHEATRTGHMRSETARACLGIRIP